MYKEVALTSHLNLHSQRWREKCRWWKTPVQINKPGKKKGGEGKAHSIWKLCHKFRGTMHIQQHMKASLWPCSLNVYLISSLVVTMFSMWHFGWKENYATQMHSVTEQPSDSEFTKDAVVQQITTFSALTWVHVRDMGTQTASNNQS